MNNKQSALARKQLERRLAPLRAMHLIAPPKGWVKAIRESLGMTARQLASRMNTVPSRIAAIEQAEVRGATTLETLRKAATAMNCALVYALVPIEPLDDIVRARAIEKVQGDLARLDHTMRLENQALLKADLDAEEQRMVDQILSGPLGRLWDDRSSGRD